MDAAAEDTICAIATPVGEGGIGIVRVSGPQAVSVAQKVVRLRSAQVLEGVPSFTLQLADICFPRVAPPATDHSAFTVGHDVIDEGLVAVMRAPRSYTAEDVVELHCHGNAILLGRVVEACLMAGARLAQAGEFTKRAFLNGRLDLSQAEAVLDTIRAKSDSGLRVAQRHLRGELGHQVEALRTRLVAMLAQVEAGIDFAEEDISFIDRDELVRAIQEALASVEVMLGTVSGGRVLREGAKVVIVGRPNVGKSSLMNCLLREDRSIVTDIPGTTRDVIEEAVAFGGVRLTLVDTAGLRHTTDLVEREGMKRTERARELADMVLHVFDACEIRDRVVGFDAVTIRSNEKSLVLVNKMDLLDDSAATIVLRQVSEITHADVIPISVRSGLGLEAVKAAIRSMLCPASLEASEGVVVTNVRHADALNRAALSLDEALSAVKSGRTAECVAVDLREASDALGEITGAITSEEVLNRIFAEFCIGK